jgi:stalled ribosome rescue protein Dom34
MIRIAEQQDCQVEVVNEAEALSALGGVGCLLRYRLPDEYA